MLFNRAELAKYRFITFGETGDEWKLESLGGWLFLSKRVKANGDLARPANKTFGVYCRADHPHDFVLVYIHDFGSQSYPESQNLIFSMHVICGGSFQVIEGGSA